jgi:hypothetical protein
MENSELTASGLNFPARTRLTAYQQTLCIEPKSGYVYSAETRVRVQSGADEVQMERNGSHATIYAPNRSYSYRLPHGLSLPDHSAGPQPG